MSGEKYSGVEVDLHQRDLTEELSGFVDDLKGLSQDVSIQTLGGVHANSSNFDAARNNAITNLETQRATDLAVSSADAANIEEKYRLLINEERRRYDALSNHFGTISELHPRLDTKDGELKLYVSIPTSGRKQRRLIRRLEREHDAWVQTEQNMGRAAAIGVDTKLHSLMGGIYTNILGQVKGGQVNVSRVADGMGRVGVNVEGVARYGYPKPKCCVDPRNYKDELPSLLKNAPGTVEQKERATKLISGATTVVAIYGLYQALIKKNKNRQAARGTYGLAMLGMYIYSGNIKGPGTIVKEWLGGGESYDTIAGAVEKALGVDTGSLSKRLNISNAAAIIPAAQVSQVVKHLSYENLNKYTKTSNDKIVLIDKNKNGAADLAEYLQSLGKEKESQIVQMMYEQQGDDNILDRGLRVMGINLSNGSGPISADVKVFDKRVGSMNVFLDSANVDLQQPGMEVIERYYSGELTLQQAIKELQKGKNMLLNRDDVESKMGYINYFAPQSQHEAIGLIKDVPKTLKTIPTGDFVKYIESGYINGATTQGYVSIDRNRMEQDALPTTNALLKSVSTPAARRSLEQSLTAIFVETLNFDFDATSNNASIILGFATMGDMFESHTNMLENMMTLGLFANTNKLMPGADPSNEISSYLQTTFATDDRRQAHLDWMRDNGVDVFEYNGLGYNLEGVIGDPIMKSQLATITTLPKTVKEGFLMRGSHYKQKMGSTIPGAIFFSAAGANEINRHSYGQKTTLNRQTKELRLSTGTTLNFNTETIPEMLQFAHYINSASMFKGTSNDHTPRQRDNGTLQFQKNNSALEWFQDIISGTSLGSYKDGRGALDQEMLSKEGIAKNFPALLVGTNGTKIKNALNEMPGRQVLEDPDYLVAKEIEVNKQLTTLNKNRGGVPLTTIKSKNLSNFVLTASVGGVTKEVILNVRDLTVGKYGFFPIGHGDIEAATTAADKYLQAKLAINLIGRIKAAGSASKRAAIVGGTGVDGFLKGIGINVGDILDETQGAIKAVMTFIGDDVRKAIKEFGIGTGETLGGLFDIADFGFDRLVSKPISALGDLLD